MDDIGYPTGAARFAAGTFIGPVDAGSRGGFRGVYRDTQLYVAWRLAALKALPKNESLFPYQRDDDAFLVRSSPMPFHHTARIALAQARTMTMLQAT